jgi:hypothetical protein
MASFVGAIEQFNPYIQQIPTEAYTKVGMFKEQMYEAGLAKVQDSIDKIAGLDVANEGGRTYLKNRVDELTKNLNRYSMVDFSNPNNITQLTSLGKSLYSDENIVNDVINTGVYRKWASSAQKKMESGHMDAVQYYYEQQEASKWLGSKVAGSQYTGRSIPNDATYEKVNKKVLDFKSKLKPDTRYVEGSTFMYGSKSYNVSELSELFYNNILDSNDREMLAHNTMFDDTLRYNQDPNAPKQDLIDIYNGKKGVSEDNLKKVNLQLQAFKNTDDPDYQSLVRDKVILESNIQIYNKAIAAFGQTDPTNESQKKGIYTNISGEQYKNSISAIFETEELEPKYREDVKQSRDHKNATVNAAIAKGTVAFTQLKDPDGNPMWDDKGAPVMGIRAVLDENNDPTILEKQSDLITTVDANGNIISVPRAKTGKKTNPLANILQGNPGEVANFNVAGEGDIIHLDKDILSNEFFQLDGMIQQNVMAMTNTMARASTAGFNITDYYTLEQIPGPDGKDVTAMVWKSPEKKKEFMSYVDMMNSAFEIEAADGNQANKSFYRYISGELAADAPELGLQGVDPAIVKDLMTLKGKNAVLSAMDEVFKDKSVVKNLTAIDEATTQKKDISDSWRKVLTANVKNAAEREIINKLTDQDIMRLSAPETNTVENAFQVTPQQANKLEGMLLKYTPNGDRTYTLTAYGFEKHDDPSKPSYVVSRNVPEEIALKNKDKGSLQTQYSKYLPGGLTQGEHLAVTSKSPKDLVEGAPGLGGSYMESLTGGASNPFNIDSETIRRANNELKTAYSVIRQNITRSVSLLNIPENKQDKDALIQGITNSLINQGGAKILTDPTFIQPNQDDIASITKVVDITGASNKSVGNIFNNSGFLNIQFEYQDGEGKKKEGTASYNIDRILGTDPAFASKFSKYFAGLKYAKEGAAIRIKSYIDPTSGHKTYSGDGTGNTVSPLGNIFSDQKGYIGKEFTRYMIPTADGHQVPINYKVVSYGDSEEIGNKLNNTNIDSNKYAVQLQVNTPSGKQNIFMKGLTGDIIQYNTPEEALYQLKDELFKNVPIDNAADMIKKKDGTKVVNYFSEFNQFKPSIRGFFNTQLKLNGINVSNIDDIKKAYADLVAGKSSEIDKELLKFTPIY